MRAGRPLLAGLVLAAAVLPQPAVPASAESPSFDCAAAEGEIEELICYDTTLAGLDRDLADVYRRAIESLPPDDAKQQKSIQRGWIKGRNECWKAADPAACTTYMYQARIVELQIISGQLAVPEPVGYDCEDHQGPFFVVFYSDTNPPAVVLTRASDQVVAFRASSASGARYVAANVEFWEHHGEATVAWFGKKFVCTVRQ